MTLKVQYVANNMPASDAFTVTPSDTVDFTQPVRALYIGGPGTVVLNTMNGTQVTFNALQAGTILPVACSRVFASNTTVTAGNIIALV